MIELILAFALFCTSSNEFELSNTILKCTQPNKAIAHQYYYIQAINAHALNQRELARKSVHNFNNFFTDVEPPIRYQRIISMIENDIDKWEKEGVVGDIQREMRQSKDRLATAKGGPTTQKIQDDILRKLDDMIKEKQDQANGAGSKENSEGEKSAKLPKNKSSSPAQESLPSDSEKLPGKVEGELRKLNATWGTLSEKQRAEAIANVTRELPAKYKVVIEDYYRALSRNK